MPNKKMSHDKSELLQQQIFVKKGNNYKVYVEKYA